MTKSIITITIILTLSTSAALAAHQTHHRHAMNAYAVSPVVSARGVSSSDDATYIRNLRDSGYAVLAQREGKNLPPGMRGNPPWKMRTHCNHKAKMLGTPCL